MPLSKKERELYSLLIPRPDLTGQKLSETWVEAKLNNPKLSYKEFAKDVNLPIDILLGRMTTWSNEKFGSFVDYNLGEPLSVEGNAMIVGDVHVPFTDWEFASLVSLVAKKLFPRKQDRRLIIGGDYFNFDAFSSFPTIIKGPTLTEELKHGRNLIEIWLREFDEIVLLLGNHDRRPLRETDGDLTTSEILDWLGLPARLTVSDFGWCVLKSGDELWRVTHPRNYSRIPLRVVNQIAQKSQMNIVGFHEHLFGISWDDYGRYLICNGGMLADAKKLAYVTMDDTTKPTMKQGFAAVRDGVPYLFGRSPFTDWDNLITKRVI